MHRAVSDPNGPAGSTGVVAAPEDTAGALRRRLHGQRDCAWDLICIVDSRHHLLGTLTGQELSALADDGHARRRGAPRPPAGARPA